MGVVQDHTNNHRAASCISYPTYPSFRKALGLTAVTVGLGVPSLAYALGVGGVETLSYIGQPLRVEVPLYNVESPNTLEIQLERLDGAESDGLTAVLSRANSQLSVVIKSQEAVNEPYFNFALNLTDQGNEFRKQFTVLLDLSPKGGPSSVARAQPANTQRLQAYDVDPTVSNNSANGSVMGPYEWAKAGQIPEKFGAVLDGQSLWRVARRISPAMNASNNQMMWALYQANPQAFSSTSIESLRAGTFLTIPSADTVTSTTDREAKRLLDGLSINNSPAAPQAAAAPQVANQDATNDASELDEFGLADAATQTPADEPSNAGTNSSVGGQFQLSGLDSAVTKGGSLVSASDDQSKEIIASLSETISSMTEQLGRKDRQIEVLESQVSELKAFIQEDGSLGSVPTSTLSVDVPVDSLAGIEAEPSEPSSVVSINVPSGVAATDVQAQPQIQSQPQSAASSNWYIWVLAALAAIGLLGFALRDRLLRLWRSLNFSGANDHLEFQPTVFNEALNQALVEKEHSHQSTSHHTVTVSQNTHHFSESEYNEPFSEPFTEAFSEVKSEIFVDEDTPEEELDFEQRFARLLAEGDLEFARQLLDIAHGHDVNDERYHFHRLQLLALKYDEDAFYDYYYSIENDIPQFTNLVQTDISKLVVQLAKH